ncbi:uncharacterized protein PSFLO_01260 [Pseudozyma flocculosa]|uniref:Uncharacterized protein n=1 Tax=Pseudozyma flocculosa TaxID=84751 RepID=A0A5C3EX79_9BASI|nr:uncharacterized protein PSFLO_01260 [Pseudozyma flocculosa]
MHGYATKCGATTQPAWQTHDKQAAAAETHARAHLPPAEDRGLQGLAWRAGGLASDPNLPARFGTDRPTDRPSTLARSFGPGIRSDAILSVLTLIPFLSQRGPSSCRSPHAHTHTHTQKERGRTLLYSGIDRSESAARASCFILHTSAMRCEAFEERNATMTPSPSPLPSPQPPSSVPPSVAMPCRVVPCRVESPSEQKVPPPGLVRGALASLPAWSLLPGPAHSPKARVFRAARRP